MKIILASGSPRRRELLTQAGYTFEVKVSEADENVDIENPVDLVKELASRKAGAVARELAADTIQEEYLVIGADTIVVYKNQVLGKPEDKEDAYRMMHLLSGQVHQVYTGVAFYIVKEGKAFLEKSFYEQTDVKIRDMGEEEIRDYVENTEDWCDKAGGYGIQTAFGVKFIPAITGDYYNVVGFPGCKVGQELTNTFEKYGI